MRQAFDFDRRRAVPRSARCSFHCALCGDGGEQQRGSADHQCADARLVEHGEHDGHAVDEHDADERVERRGGHGHPRLGVDLVGVERQRRTMSAAKAAYAATMATNCPPVATPS